MKEWLLLLVFNFDVLIFDFCDNVGGLLDVVVDIVDMFLVEGDVIVSICGCDGRVWKEYFVNGENIIVLCSMLIVVLINWFLVSVSEILVVVF